MERPERPFVGLLAQCSEVVQVDYRRRQDQAEAAAAVAQQLWQSMRANRVNRKQLDDSKWVSRAPIVLLFLGAALNWWLTSGEPWDFNLGLFLMFVGAVIFGNAKFEAWQLDNEHRLLLAEQTGLLCTWRQSGSAVSSFYELWRLWQEDRKADDAAADSGEKQRGRDSVESARAALWQEVRERHYERASGV